MILRRLWVLAVLPAIVLLPVLSAPLPLTNSHGLREIAGYFQALALLRTGFESFTYLTPSESLSALHLHSLLSTPFIALGYREAGRLVSLVAAIVGAVVLSKLATDAYGHRAGLLAPLFLWIQPLFARFAARWWPEAVSIALTIGAVYAAYQYTQSDDRRFALLTLVLLGVAPTNHMWEASIALPITALFVATRKCRYAALSTIVTGAAIAGVWVGTSFQPAGASTLTQFGLHNDPTILLDLSWWNRMAKFPTHPTVVEQTFLTPAAIIVTAITGYRAFDGFDPRDVLISTWVLSGLAIPLLLPFGADNHMYYLWGLVAPIALFCASETSRLISAAPDTVNRQKVTHGVLSVLLITALISGLVFETGIFEAAGGPEPLSTAVDGDMHSQVDGFKYGELKGVGQEIRSNGVTRASDITFVGEWGQSGGAHLSPRERTLRFAQRRVLIYSDVLVIGQGGEQSSRPSFVGNETEATDCVRRVVRNETAVWTEPCG